MPLLLFSGRIKQRIHENDTHPSHPQAGSNSVTGLKPCVRCESELPPAAFPHPESAFCNDCTEEIVSIIRTKYNAIEAAHFRAKLRRRSREAMEELRRKLS